MSRSKPRKPILSRTREQYETFPYPARRAEEEDQRLITGSPGDWGEVVHYVFGGRDPGAKDAPLRILVAGGGTGDAVVMLAQQAHDRGANAEIVYIDLSAASREIAEGRIRRRGLENVTFVTGSFVDLAAQYGPYDYIDCCGVLHHLPDPDAGLRALAGSLKPGGGMGLMVYATIGRTGVYHMQEMMQRLSAEAEGRARLETGKALFAGLPPTNWLKRNPFVNDHISGGDAGFYDLLLHQQDRAYRVDEVYDFVEQAGLRLQNFVEPLRYDPAIYTTSDDIGAKLAVLPPRQRHAMAELLAGNITKHIFYVVKTDNKTRPVEIAQPAKAGMPRVGGQDIGAMVPYLGRVDGAKLAASVAKSAQIKINFSGFALIRKLPPASAAILARVDGQRSLENIRQSFDPVPESWPFYAQVAALFAVLSAANLLFLRHPA
ncbi:class I SAM-dependent methyltransferase [Thalassospira mesophila]|uniref:Methyltransferase n=1 Tax=Thalassospira mesophila TaxID=1293891 RepID=A0A1Y2L563_9PROT|nr:class I SAM-dependent methyltransferase [Thalassospira mesophila]OSQ40613.1 methyltransferase [Thalassospira mesophila]